MNKRKAEYRIDPSERCKFIIKNYNFSKPFTNFFPGIAGPQGSPLWCFYTNRGQCITSFGTDNKDSAILEFQPANKAYALTTTNGFRTFIKIKNDKQVIYEPFSERNNNDDNISNEMSVTPFSLDISEENKTLGLKITITYFTLPGESLASLIRKISIENLNSNKFSFELLDGLPVINPYGIKNESLKFMSRTSEAWSFVENLEKYVPFYHVKTSMEDVSQVKLEKRGNFFLSFFETHDGPCLLEPVVDPMMIFGNSPDMQYPYKFAESSFDAKSIQHYENRSTCAMAHGNFEISSGEKREITSIVGHAPDIDTLNSFITSRCNDDYINTKYMENKNIIMELMDTLFISSSSVNFDNYAGQTFLDNILRGGFPMSIQHEGKKDALYLYSRKHGDPERDYNDFLLKGTYLSYGNGNFRDITQNRRNDLWYNIDVGVSNIEYFVNLIQLDGHNPLVVQGSLYHFNKKSINIENLIDSKISNELDQLLSRQFQISELSDFYRIHEKNIKVSITNFISPILLNCEKRELTYHHEGFWIDHWFYITDLIESYGAIFPDCLNDLMFNKQSFSFYDNANYVAPRSEKYIFNDNSLRQYNSVRLDEKKMMQIQSRQGDNPWVRTKNGTGKIYNTTLFIKLFTLILNKIATLDAHGTGIEMDSDKPGWNDSLNGLPGLFGSSTCETQQLYRLVNFLLNFDYDEIKIILPIEIYSFYKKLSTILNSSNKNEIDDFTYWDRATSAKEIYRKKIHLGISGKEKTLHGNKTKDFLQCVKEKLKSGINKSFDPEKEMYYTYYINTPTKHSGKKISEFSQKPLPLFLEGQMHALLNEVKIEECSRIFEAVKKSSLYDKKLQMYKVNESLEDCSYEIGRARTFTPGWLENESIFLHMHYKYLLSLLRCGLHNNFFEEIKKGLVPFLKPEIYGRSIFENSSFIASSANPDESIHGSGYICRLSGSTAEFIHILLYMSLGPTPFKLNKKQELLFSPEPVLPGWLFSTEDKIKKRYVEGKIKNLEIPAGTFAINFLGNTLVAYRNKSQKNTVGNDRVCIKKILLTENNDNIIEISGKEVGPPYSTKLRDGRYTRVDILLE